MKKNIDLLDEIKELYDIPTYVELGKRFQIPVKTIDNWISKKTIPKRGLSLIYIKLLISNAKKELALQNKLSETQELIKKWNESY